MKIRFILFTILSVLIGGCSNIEEPAFTDKSINDSDAVRNRFTISQAEGIASSIIAEFSNESVTRTSDSTPDVEIILRSSKTRSQSSNDTLAYVFNYPDNGGFVIMSPDPKLEDPLVAYSDKGHINTSDDFVKTQIFNPLEYYIETIPSYTSTRVVLPGGNYHIVYDVLEWLSPQIIISLDQDAPWNKVVTAKLGNGYLAGCVPVAAALVMSRCKDSFSLRGKNYNFKEITKCIAINQGVSGLGTTKYSYEQAVNEMAQLLWDLGQEFDAKYIVDRTGADSTKAVPMIINWGFASPFSTYKYNYTADILKTYLETNNVIYVTGNRENSGHAWVCDGYQVRRNKSAISGIVFPSVTYVHMNWGLGGWCDGYFSGSIYTPVDGYTYEANLYCPFKINY